MPVKNRIYCTVMAFVLTSLIGVLGNLIFIGKNIPEGIAEALAGGIGAGIATFYLLSRNANKRIYK